ncbi:MAG TPA: copper oxidase [Thermoanaerobaculia bacterium]|nr:copper oxidase [Thermoanaerobaculia bacterium]
MTNDRTKTDRRRFLGGGALATGALLGRRVLFGQPPPHHEHHESAPQPPAPAPAPAPASAGAVSRAPRRPSYVSVETPEVPLLPWRLVGGVKEFHLSCDVVASRFLPWREPFNVWGYTGSMPGPTIEVVEGDRVRFVVHNRLPEATSMHWHGLEVPNEMDGVPGLHQDPIPPGGVFVYEFTLHQHGTFFYHSHMPMQEMLGMIGFFVVHPREPYAPRVHRDFALLFQGWAILPNNPTPNTLAMEFNWLTINGKAGPATTPLLVKQGERVRMRLVNLGMDHHPIHMHGHQWQVVGTEAGRIPRSAWEPANTVLLGVAQSRDVEFEAEHLGDWMIHCHLPHHMMNHMASMVGPLSDPGGGVAAGRSMERGMGMLHGGHALGEENGPSLGRSLGAGNAEEAVGHLAGPAHQGPQEPPPGGDPHQDHASHAAARDARAVPGYPQDHFMTMDEPFADRPEYWGLRPGWSGGMMGMMTMVRVLPPHLFDTLAELRDRKRRDPDLKLPAPPPRSAFLGREPRVIDASPWTGHDEKEPS